MKKAVVEWQLPFFIVRLNSSITEDYLFKFHLLHHRRKKSL